MAKYSSQDYKILHLLSTAKPSKPWWKFSNTPYLTINKIKLLATTCVSSGKFTLHATIKATSFSLLNLLQFSHEIWVWKKLAKLWNFHAQNRKDVWWWTKLRHSPCLYQVVQDVQCFPSEESKAEIPGKKDIGSSPKLTELGNEIARGRSLDKQNKELY